MFRTGSLLPTHRALAPRERHRGRGSVPILTDILRALLEPTGEAGQLFHRFFVDLPALLGGAQFRVTEDTGFRIAARPRYHRGRTRREQVDPLERAVLIVETDRPALDLILADVVAIEVHVQRSFEFAGMGTAAGELALPPAGQEFLVDRQEVPPAGEDAFRIGFDIGTPGHEIKVRHVGTVAIQQNDLLEAVVGQRFRDVEDVVHEMFKVVVDRPRKVHDMPGVTVGYHGEYENLVGNRLTGTVGDADRADEIDIQRQVWPVLFDGSARHDTDLLQIDGIVDFRPGQFFVAVLGRGSAHRELSCGCFRVSGLFCTICFVAGTGTEGRRMGRTTRIGLVGVAVAALGVGLVWQPWNVTADPQRERFADDRPQPSAGETPMAARDQFGQDRPGAAPDTNAIPFDGKRAIHYLTELCEIGPRVSGTAGMAKQQKRLIEHFEKHGAKVVRQEFSAQQRSRKEPVTMTNLIASWHPERTRRILLCAHYDTRPAADQEPNRRDWNKPFVSANDGTSGVAFLMELAHFVPDIPTGVGIDFVLFDGEEYIFDPGVPGIREGDKYFFGSEHFAREYSRNRGQSEMRYEAGVLFDLFAHPKARLAVEGHSLAFAPGLVTQIWKTAEAVGAKSFQYERGFLRGYDVLDDHVPLNRAGIPTVDIIDFDYEHWHRLTDTPDKCSPKQMSEVARVIAAWLQGLK